MSTSAYSGARSEGLRGSSINRLSLGNNFAQFPTDRSLPFSQPPDGWMLPLASFKGSPTDVPARPRYVAEVLSLVDGALKPCIELVKSFCVSEGCNIVKDKDLEEKPVEMIEACIKHVKKYESLLDASFHDQSKGSRDVEFSSAVKKAFDEIVNTLTAKFTFAPLPALLFGEMVKATVNDKKNNKLQIQCALLNGVGKNKINVHVTPMEILESLEFYNSITT